MERRIISCFRDQSRETNFNAESGRQTEGNNCMTRTNSSQDSRTTRFNIDHPPPAFPFRVFPFYRLPTPLSLPSNLQSWRRFRYLVLRVMQQDRKWAQRGGRNCGRGGSSLLIRMMALMCIRNARGTDMTQPPVTLP